MSQINSPHWPCLIYLGTFTNLAVIPRTSTAKANPVSGQQKRHRQTPSLQECSRRNLLHWPRHGRSRGTPTPTARLRVERNAYTSTGRLPSAEAEKPLSHVFTRDKVTQSTKQTKCEATSKLLNTTTVSHTSRRTPRKKYHAAAESIRETSSNVRPLIRTELPSHMNRATQGVQQTQCQIL